MKTPLAPETGLSVVPVESQPECETDGAGSSTKNTRNKVQEPLVPTWNHELELHSKGYKLLAGVDEAGRGSWAGPLVAAAVIFDPGAPPGEACVPDRYAEL